ncbi:alpha/beta-hydrolase [Fomitopsis serialis]|uniref:alpha/beta-hydrolase n=1 Tax=Fomitopsis serialis TaxID=139415 RepID=UPI0020077B6F|nr:alpha/beta-hydrolase [Neoantrodia serialis]KAH9931800.1 alpha/beta-hydrolase [Neoantrodia serialis]
MSEPLCIDCISGVRHEGVPEGKIEQIGGVESYVATPTGEYAKEKVVLFLPDVFGLALINNRLLVDDIARNGFWCVMPDYFEGDSIPEDAMNPENRDKFDRVGWFSRHGDNAWKPIVDKVVAALKEQGVTRFGTTGYCYGAPAAFYLAWSNTSHVTVVSHPSRLQVPGDLEKYRAESKAPLLINGCEVDSQFPPESQKIADEVFGDGKFVPGYERTYWDGCTHGFAVRGDMSNPKVKAGKEGSFEATIKFYKKHL